MARQAGKTSNSTTSTSSHTPLTSLCTLPTLTHNRYRASTEAHPSCGNTLLSGSFLCDPASLCHSLCTVNKPSSSSCVIFEYTFLLLLPPPPPPLPRHPPPHPPSWRACWSLILHTRTIKQYPEECQRRLVASEKVTVVFQGVGGGGGGGGRFIQS